MLGEEEDLLFLFLKVRDSRAGRVLPSWRLFECTYILIRSYKYRD